MLRCSTFQNKPFETNKLIKAAIWLHGIPLQIRPADARCNLIIQMMTTEIKHLCLSRDIAMHTITKTRLFKYIVNFTTKNWKFSDKNSDIFFMFLHKT